VFGVIVAHEGSHFPRELPLRVQGAYTDGPATASLGPFHNAVLSPAARTRAVPAWGHIAEEFIRDAQPRLRGKPIRTQTRRLGVLGPFGSNKIEEHVCVHEDGHPKRIGAGSREQRSGIEFATEPR
jgi:hypothetical protein